MVPQLHDSRHSIAPSIPDVSAHDILGAALAYAAAGWFVGPLKPGKHPGSMLGAGWPTKTSRDPRVIAGWFAGSSAGELGVFLHVGRSGAVVLDIDSPDDLSPDLRAVLEGHQGPVQGTREGVPLRGHYVFAMPTGRALGNSTGLLGGGLDVRGDNGIIVVEPSPHPKAAEGGRYQWLRGGPVGALPEQISAALPARQVGPGQLATPVEVARFLAEHATGDPRRAAGPLSMFRAKAVRGQRHGTAIAAATWICKEARAGLYGAAGPLEQLRTAFVAAVQADRDGHAEFDGIVQWAVAAAQGLPHEAIEHVETVANRDTPAPADDVEGVLLPFRPVIHEGELGSSEYDAQLAKDVALELRRLRIRDEARRQFARENEPPGMAFDAILLRDQLLRPEGPPMRIDTLIPSDGNTVISAQRKTGKTTWVLNLMKSLMSGEPFLGSLGVQPLEPSRGVALLNFEVSDATMGRWAHEAGVDHDRLLLVNLRGKRNPLLHPEDRAALAARLRRHGTETVIVDTFGQAFRGDQNSASEVLVFLGDLGMFARTESGARDLVLTVHAGHDAERSRGSSALEDWPDSIVRLVSLDGQRFMSALGRDVDMAEDKLDFDPVTRRLTLAGAGSRKVAVVSEKALRQHAAVVNVVARDGGGLSGGVSRAAVGEALRAVGLGMRHDALADLLRRLVDQGEIGLIMGRFVPLSPLSPAVPGTGDVPVPLSPPL